MSSLTWCSPVVDMFVLGVDPGTTNFAFTVLNARTQEAVYGNVVNLTPALCTYRSIGVAVCLLMDQLLERFKFCGVCVEMQLREHMLAVMQSVVVWSLMRSVDVDVVPASAWRRRVGFRSTGNYNKNKAQSIVHLRKAFNIYTENHNVAESTLIAIGYALSKGLVEKPV